MSPHLRPDHLAAPGGRRRLARGAHRPGRIAAFACAAACLSASSAVAAPASTVLQADPSAPVRVAAGHGHVVAMEAVDGGGSRLVELAAGKTPRELGRFEGDVAWPTVGTDGAGRAVAVLSPCLRGERPTPLPDCNLAVVDLDTGATKVLPRSKGAYIGDLDRSRAVVARRSATSGVRVALTDASGKGSSRALALGTLLPTARNYGYPVSTHFVDSLDLSGRTIAATFFVGMPNGGDGGGSVLARRAVSGRGWIKIASSSYGGASGILRVFRGATVTSTGIRALYDGGDLEESYVGRWTKPGKAARAVIVEPTILSSAAFDGDRLVTAGADGAGCGAPVPCTIDTYGPLKLG